MNFDVRVRQKSLGKVTELVGQNSLGGGGRTGTEAREPTNIPQLFTTRGPIPNFRSFGTAKAKPQRQYPELAEDRVQRNEIRFTIDFLGSSETKRYLEAEATF
jgi:hypothetical protein